MSPGPARPSSREKTPKKTSRRETATRAPRSNRTPRSALNRPSRRDKKSPLPTNGRGLFFLMNGGAAGVAAAGQREADRRALRRFEALRPVILDDHAVQRQAAIEDRQRQQAVFAF